MKDRLTGYMKLILTGTIPCNTKLRNVQQYPHYQAFDIYLAIN